MRHTGKGLSESISKIFTQFHANVAGRPIRTLRNELVHPKDEVDCGEVCECIYQIPCKNCDRVYVGETARNLGIKIDEDKKRSGVKKYV